MILLRWVNSFFFLSGPVKTVEPDLRLRPSVEEVYFSFCRKWHNQKTVIPLPSHQWKKRCKPHHTTVPKYLRKRLCVVLMILLRWVSTFMFPLYISSEDYFWNKWHVLYHKHLQYTCMYLIHLCGICSIELW